jgi:hypothetical protein
VSTGVTLHPWKKQKQNHYLKKRSISFIIQTFSRTSTIAEQKKKKKEKQNIPL